MPNSSGLLLLATLTTSAFLGSWHCGMMCGPIATFSAEKNSVWFYHLGRIFSYTALGWVAGVLGHQFVFVSNLDLKIVFFILLSSLILGLAFLSQNLDESHPLKNSFQKKIIRFFIQLSKNKVYEKMGFLGLGFSSVFLPCGWLYSFVIASAATQSAWAGALVMFLFSISSVPALFAFPLFLKKVSAGTSLKQKKITTLVVLISSLYSLFSHFFIS